MHYVKCMFFQTDAIVIYYVRLVLSVRAIIEIISAAMMVLDCLPLALPRSNRNTCKQ